LSDAALIEAARDGDDDAFAALYERFLPAVRRFLRDLLRDGALAEEAAQETFVRALLRIDGLRDGLRVLPWLLGIARNVSLELRRDAGRPVRSVGLSVEDALAGQGGREQGGSAATPEELLLGREAERAVVGALEALSEDRRAVLLLRVEHDLGCAEIAQLMGWSVAKVKVEVHRARLQLRELVGRRKSGDP
jgi:RNA polymerase sigma-70 factor (ECF subfamily)